MSVHQLLREIVRVELRQLVREIVQEEAPRRGPIRNAAVESRSTYRGDSQAKKAVRLRVWELVQRVLGQDVFARGNHVFLASQEGGDASTLRGLGVKDRAMLAVDIDSAAIREFSARFPEIPTKHDDVAAVLERLSEPPASIFLDFTSQVSDHTFNKMRTALHTIRSGGVLACTFAVGREKHASFKSGPTRDAVEERLRVVEGFVEYELNYKPRVLSRMRYTSESTAGPGSSLMCVIVFQIRHGKDAEGAQLQEIGMQDMRRDLYRYRNSAELHWLFNCTTHKAEALRERVKAYPPPRVT